MKKEEESKIKIEKKIDLTLDDLEVIELFFDIGLLIEDTNTFERYKKTLCLGGPFKKNKNNIEKLFFINTRQIFKRYSITVKREIFLKISDIISNEKNQINLKIKNFDSIQKENYTVKFFHFKNKKIIFYGNVNFLKQKDFTINSILYNIYDQKIIDPYNGYQHLTEKYITCINDLESTFNPIDRYFFRYTKIARYLIFGFKIDKKIIDFIKEFFEMKIYRILHAYPNYNFFLEDNSVRILENLMKLGIFGYYHHCIPISKLNEYCFNTKFPMIYLSILNLVEKLDIFFLKREELKTIFFLSDRDIDDNEYLLKTHSIIYFFLHPIFNKNVKYFEINFFFSKINVSDKFFNLAYDLVKDFSYTKFSIFVTYFFNLKLSYPFNYNLFVFLPVLDYFNKESIIKENFLEDLKILYCFKKKFHINEKIKTKREVMNDQKENKYYSNRKKKKNKYRKRLSNN